MKAGSPTSYTDATPQLSNQKMSAPNTPICHLAGSPDYTMGTWWYRAWDEQVHRVQLAERRAMYADNPDTGFVPPEHCYAPLKRTPALESSLARFCRVGVSQKKLWAPTTGSSS